MRLGMVGLGRMGGNMSLRLMKGGHEVVAFDLDDDARARLASEGADTVERLEEIVEKLDPPRAIWLMVPSGDPTEKTISQLAVKLEDGDAIIDGGNSRYSDSVRRARDLKEKGISFVDSGTSGGVWGLENGYCLMIGAEPETYERLEPLFETLAPANGYARVGPPGAGHFTKMVHNGIEYALMQAYGEGFELLHDSDFDLDVGQIAEVWRHGSVVRSWLLDLSARALSNDPELDGISPYIEDSGEGRWTLETAIERAIPVPTIATALFARFASRQDASFAGKVISALRREFGGHAIRSAEPHAIRSAEPHAIRSAEPHAIRSPESEG